MKWTAEANRRADALMAELHQLQAAHDAALNVIADLIHQTSIGKSIDCLGLAREIVKQADAWNDALAPFDSGCRDAAG